MRALLRLFLFVLSFPTLAIPAFAAKNPDIISHAGQYLDRAISINLRWNATDPVVLVKISAGQHAKDIKIDEYDNRRNSYGYEGETTVTLPIDPSLFQSDVPYVL